MLKVSLLVATLFLSSCAPANNADSSENLVCSFVEAYIDDKALAMKSAAEGDGAEDWIQGTIGELGKGFDLSSEKIYVEYLEAMLTWAKNIDQYILASDKNILSKSASDLELKINNIQRLCENSGWKFKSNWR